MFSNVSLDLKKIRKINQSHFEFYLVFVRRKYFVRVLPQDYLCHQLRYNCDTNC